MRRAESQPRLSRPLRLVEVDDSTLVERLAQGDTSALGDLYDRHSRGLFAFLARVASFDEAEDLVHTTFLRASTRAKSYDPKKGEARGWLFGIAAKVVQERRRALLRRARAFLRAKTSETTTTSTTGERNDVARALETLSEAKRVVVVLSEVEGFSCQEIADMMEIPVGTVWTRLHHARNELRTYFERGAP
jgi:RNA polymerase sigma factor (sigma-70 family)